MSKLQNMRCIEIPAFRAVSSGEQTLNQLFEDDSKFQKWVSENDKLIRKQIFEPSDFLYHVDRDINRSVWILAVNDDVTEKDTSPYALIDFPGGMYLVATADESNSDDINETVDTMMAWINSNEVFEYGDFPESGMCNMPNPDGNIDKALHISQQQIFLPLKYRKNV